MISENLKQLREKAGMTQKNLADKLFVSPQAVSRWESGDTEPSATTLNQLANIFGVSIDELFGHPAPKPEVVVKKETIYTAAPAVLGVCDKCKKVITDVNDYVKITHGARRKTYSCLCKSCDDKIKKAKIEADIKYGIKCRKKSFIWGGIITAIILFISILLVVNGDYSTGTNAGFIIVALLFFPFLSCIFLKNNFVLEMIGTIFSFGFIKFPGLIFSLDLDGIFWFITVKLLFCIIGILLAVAAFLIAVTIGLLVSVFVYPFALIKNIRHPEKSEKFF